MVYMFSGDAYETLLEWGKRYGRQVLWNEDLPRAALKGDTSASGLESQVPFKEKEEKIAAKKIAE